MLVQQHGMTRSKRPRVPSPVLNTGGNLHEISHNRDANSFMCITATLSFWPADWSHLTLSGFLSELAEFSWTVKQKTWSVWKWDEGKYNIPGIVRLGISHQQKHSKNTDCVFKKKSAMCSSFLKAEDWQLWNSCSSKNHVNLPEWDCLIVRSKPILDSRIVVLFPLERSMMLCEVISPI